MSGSISSAQARQHVEEKVEEVKIPDGSLSSHDLIRPKAVEVQVESTTPQEAAPEVVEEVKVEEKKDSPDFRSLRQRAEAAAREAREKEEIIQRLLRAQASQPTLMHSPQEESGADEIIERRHLSPLEQRLARLEAENEKLKQITTVELSKRELKGKYSDFDKVMTEDNLKDLEYMNPAVARTLQSSPDYEGAAMIAYHMIKAQGIYKDEQPKYAVNYERDKQRAMDNMSKPRPVNAIGKSSTPLGELSPFHIEQTKERKDMLWSKMQKKLRTKKSF